MKKKTLLLVKRSLLIVGVLVGLVGFQAEAQSVSTYTFAQSVTTFTPITGGTVLGTTTSDDQRFIDPAIPAGGTVLTGVGFPIGFSFSYNGSIYDRFGVNNNGWISLGQSALTPAVNMNSSTSYYAIGSTTVITPSTLRARIGGFARDLAAQPGAELRFQTIGTAPNRTLVIQWIGYRRFAGTGENLNFQIRLNESNNSVETVYGTMTASTVDMTPQVGLGGTSNTEYNIRTGNNWAASLPGTVGTAQMNFSSTTPIVQGTRYVWSQPLPCTGTPTAGTIASSAGNTFCGTATTTLSLSGQSQGTGITYQWQSSPTGAVWTNVGTLNSTTYDVPGITASTLYRVQVTCTNSSSTVIAGPVLINVSPSPAVGATTSAAFICGSGSVTLNAYGASSYSWSPGTGLSGTTGSQVTATPTVNTTYTVTGTLGSCTGIAAVAVNVAPAIPALTTTATPTAVCVGASTQLETNQAVGTNYSVYNIAPVMQTQTTPTPVTFSSNDDGNALVTIPFSFDFYGNNYTSCYIGTNGYVSFGTGYTTLSGHNLPAATTPNNIISIFWHDMNYNNGGTCTYSTEGVAPNRRFVISFNNVKDFSNGPLSNNNGQIVLYETTNIIDVVVTETQNTGTSYNRVLGIENATGSAATVPTGRNLGAWSILANAPEGYRFARPAYNYAWTPSGGLSNAAIYNPVASNVTANTTYNVVVTDAATGCSNTGSVAVTVNPAPTATMALNTPTVCAGDQPSLTFTGTPNAEVVYNINGVNPQTVTLDGSGNLTTLAPVATANTTYDLVGATNTTTSCSAPLTGTVNVTVNPRPMGLMIGSTSVCRDQAATISYNTGSTTFPITVTYSDGTNSYTATATSSSENFTVPTNVPGIYTYEITALSDVNGCNAVAGDFSGTATVEVKALPTATVTSAASGVCTGGSTDITITFTGDAPFVFSYFDGTGSVSPAPELTNSYMFTTSALTAPTTYYVETLLGGTCLAEPAGIASTATVAIWQDVAITTQPSAVSACSENSATITMTATGENLSYVWYEDGVDVSTLGANYTVSNNTLTINNVSGLGGNAYNVIVSGTCGAPQTSTNAILTESFGNDWNGAVSTAWSDPMNWSCGSIPIITTNVNVPTIAPHMPLVDIPTALCNDITLTGAGATLGFTGVGNQLSVHGDLTNSGGTFNGTGGTIELAGTTQSIVGALTFDYLDVNGGGTKTLNGDVTVQGILNLVNGTVELGSSNLNLQMPWSQMGGSATSYIITNGTGAVTGEGMGAVGGNPDEVTFHVGINGTSYTPVKLENLGDADDYSVRVMENVYVDGDGTDPTEVTNPVVDRTWMVSEGTAGGSIVNMTPYWNTVDEINVFDQTHVYVAHHMNGEWTADIDSAINAPAALPFGSMWMTTEDSIMSFSPFTVASYGQFPLSIRLTSISALNAGPRNKVEWKSATEAAGDNYELERSADAKSFTKIATIAANGKPSTYLHWDESPVQGVNYYRVKLVDANGNYSYSKVVSATVKGTNDFTIEAYPNPVHSTVSVKVNGMVTGRGSVVVTDVTGKVVTTATAVENNSAELNVSHLANGMYLLNYTDDVRNESIKINKQ